MSGFNMLFTFINFDASTTADIIDYGSSLVADFLPLIVIYLGLGIGLWVIGRLIFGGK